jgi:NhaP-type Na+/H+ or K+/H+ antiporter
MGHSITMLAASTATYLPPLLNGLLFVLIGLQLHSILTAIEGWPLPMMLSDALIICLTVILTRIGCVFPAAYLPRALSARLRQVDPYPGWRNVLRTIERELDLEEQRASR